MAEGIPKASERGTQSRNGDDPSGVVLPSPRRNLESIGSPGEPTASDSADKVDIMRVAPGVVGTPDEPILHRLAVLAVGNPVRIMQAVEFVRVHPAQAIRMRDAAPLNEPARHVLSAALAIPKTHMEQHGIEPSTAALHSLMQSTIYTQRHNAVAHAITRDELALATRNHNYALIGGLAVLAAGEVIPPWHEIFPTAPRIQSHEPVE